MKMSVFSGFTVLALLSIVSRAAGTDEGGYEVIANANGFMCEIPGCPDASKNIREIAIDELNIDFRPGRTGTEVGYRVYGPGTPHFGNAVFTCARTAGGSKELHAWFLEASRGKNIRKTIMVTLFKSDKTPGRGYNLLDCFPTSYSAADKDPVTGVSTESITVKIGRIELTTRTAPPSPGSSGGIGPNPHRSPDEPAADEFAPVLGFSVEIAGQGGEEVDNAWESVAGGELLIELAESTIGGDQFKTRSPGHKSVGEITLRGAMTDKRAALCQWINDTVQGRPWKRSLTITELLSRDGSAKPGKTYTYFDCFPIRYTFPRLSVTNVTGNAPEEVVCRVVRWASDLPPRLVGAIEIPDAPIACEDALAIAVEDMAMDVNLVPLTGDARNPQATIFLPQGSASELKDWLRNVQAGTRDSRDVTVELGDPQRGRFLRRIFLDDCYPVEHGVSEVGGRVMEEVTIKPIRLELQ